MANIQTNTALANLPAELVATVVADAARDANQVGLFLQSMGLAMSPQTPPSIPAGLLLHLGAAMRLLRWEMQGFHFHQEAGLPTAMEALRDALLSLNDPQHDPTELSVRVMRLAVERFAWHGLHDSDADVALDDLDDDAALEALAEFLWAQRHAGIVSHHPQS